MGVDQPQPAIRPPRSSGQGPAPPAGGPEPRDATPTPDGATPAAPHAPGPDLLSGATALVGRIRGIRLFRTSSAIVRWAVLVVVVGAGAGLLIALGIKLLVSLVPQT